MAGETIRCLNKLNFSLNKSKEIKYKLVLKDERKLNKLIINLSQFK